MLQVGALSIQPASFTTVSDAVDLAALNAQPSCFREAMQKGEKDGNLAPAKFCKHHRRIFLPALDILTVTHLPM